MDRDLSEAHQIGEVAEMVGLSLRTIRHYEEVGLVPPSGRTAGGFRLYTDSDVERLRLVKLMKPLGFTLDEMRELLELQDRLRSSTASDDPEHAGLLDRMRMFVAVADERCARLRDELQQVEGFARALRREVSHAADRRTQATNRSS
jgi:MerR family copper efflux transcriptional regulator